MLPERALICLSPATMRGSFFCAGEKLNLTKTAIIISKNALVRVTACFYTYAVKNFKSRPA